MALETATFLNGLVASNPTSGDQVRQGDDHLRLIKATLKNTFPNLTGAMNATQAELNHVVGVTSGIQAQINSKQATITGGASSITSANLAASRALISDASGKVAVSPVTSTELGYLDGVTSNIQTQIDNAGFAQTSLTAVSSVFTCDVGQFQSFDLGSVSSDFTLAFTNIPTNAKWDVIAQMEPSGGYNVKETPTVLDEQSYVGTSITENAIYFSTDGTKFAILNNSGDSIEVRTLSTAWDLSTINQTPASTFNTNANGGEANPKAFFMRDDGLKAYIIGSTLDSIMEITLTTAWNLSTATLTRTRDVTAQTTSATFILFNPSGTKVWLGGAGDIHEYTLGTAWDVSTTTYVGQLTTDIEGLNQTFALLYQIAWADDGMSIMLAREGSSIDTFEKFSLSTAYDLSTLTAVVADVQVFNPNSVPPINIINAPEGIFIHPNGRIAYVLSALGNIYAVDIAQYPTVTFPASVVNVPQGSYVNQVVTYTFQTDDGGVTVKTIGEEII